MKKTLILFCFAFMSLIAQAQTWNITVQEQDELLDRAEDVTAYIFTVPDDGGIVFWEGKFQYRLFSDAGIFNYENSDGYIGMEVLIGLYDDNDKLVEKFKMWLDKEDAAAGKFIRTRNMGGMFNPVGQKGKVRKMIQHLNKGKGYVRIVAERYDAPLFDIKVTPCEEKIK